MIKVKGEDGEIINYDKEEEEDGEEGEAATPGVIESENTLAMIQ